VAVDDVGGDAVGVAGEISGDVFWRADLRVARAARDVPTAQKLEVPKARGAAEPTAGERRRAEQVQVVRDEPHHPRAHEPFEERGAFDVVVRAAQGLADVVQRRRRDHHRVFALAPRVLVHLERVVEGVALGVITGVLRDAVEAAEQVEEVVVHRWRAAVGGELFPGGRSSTGRAHTHRAVIPSGAPVSYRALLSTVTLALACASRPPPVVATPIAVTAPPPPVADAPVAEEDAHFLVPDNPFAAELAARPPLPATPAGRGFRGLDVDALLQDIATRPVQRTVERFSSSTMVFHMALEGGLEIAFKPSRRGEGSWWRHEIAGYRLARVLGIDALVPPAIFRRVPLAAFGEFARGAELVVHDGFVEGAAIFWMPVLRRSGLTEPESRAEWAEWMRAGAAVPPERVRRASQIAALIAFDYLQANFDRWNSANVRMDENEDLVLRDNNRAWFEENLALMDRGGIAHIDRVPRAMLPRIESATAEVLQQELARDPYRRHELIDRRQLRLYDQRRLELLRRIREVIARDGEAAALLGD